MDISIGQVVVANRQDSFYSYAFDSSFDILIFRVVDLKTLLRLSIA